MQDLLLSILKEELILPYRKRTMKIALLDVFLTTPNETPRYEMSFIYSLVYDDKKESWLMNGLEEVQVKIVEYKNTLPSGGY